MLGCGLIEKDLGHKKSDLADQQQQELVLLRKLVDIAQATHVFSLRFMP